MFDIAAMGELLIDFTPFENNSLSFQANPGGAPANVLTAASHLGCKCAFIGKVGGDVFGHRLENVLTEQKINTDGLVFDKKAHTTITFVCLDGHGDRSFSFYRNQSADTMLTEDEVNYDAIDKATIFHFGSLSLTDEPARLATKRAIEYAVKKHKILSYDPNYRPALWKSKDEAIKNMSYPLEYADIIKLSEEELFLLTSESDLDKGTDILLEKGIRMIAVTLGPRGCYYKCKSGSGILPTYDTKVIDTTGSGDCFWGTMLYSLSKNKINPDSITAKQLSEFADFSNAAGALCASKRGAIPAMPTFAEIEQCIKTTPKLI